MARITSRQAQEMMDAYAKVYENKEETAVETPVNEKPVEDIQERTLLRPSERAAQSAQTGANFKKATAGYKFSGSMQPGGNLRVDPVAKPQPTAQPVARPGAGVGAAAGRVAAGAAGAAGGRAAGAVGGGQPQQRPVAGGARAIGQKVGGAIGGGIDRGINRVRGGLSRLGALAGRAVGAARSAAGNVGAAAGRAAGAVASGAKRVAGGVADAATGNMTDFDKRGGKPQGVARVVAGGIDKLTGDRTDLDKRGVTPLNAGQRAAQQQKQQAQPTQQQTKPAPQQAKPAPQQAQQPVKKMGATEKANRARLGDERVDALKAKNAEFQAAKKSGNLKQYRKDNPKLSGRERAQQMARERIAAKKAAATPVNASYDPIENLFDDTVQFLVSEGHAKDVSEAMSIMSESEFIDAFNQEING